MYKNSKGQDGVSIILWRGVDVNNDLLQSSSRYDFNQYHYVVGHMESALIEYIGCLDRIGGILFPAF